MCEVELGTQSLLEVTIVLSVGSASQRKEPVYIQQTLLVGHADILIPTVPGLGEGSGCR